MATAPAADHEIAPAIRRLGLMPDWPARLGEDQAALYLGVSKSMFRAGWDCERPTYPVPVREGARLLWSRRQLDDWVDAQFGRTREPGPKPGKGRTEGWRK